MPVNKIGAGLEDARAAEDLRGGAGVDGNGGELVRNNEAKAVSESRGGEED